MAGPASPFIDMLRKFGSDLNLPRLQIDKVIESHRKNIEAIGSSADALSGGAKSIAEKQREILESMLHEASTMVRDFKPEGGVTTIIPRQVEFARKTFDFAVRNTREIAELANKSTAEALKILQDRVQTGLKEIRDSVAKDSSENKP